MIATTRNWNTVNTLLKLATPLAMMPAILLTLGTTGFKVESTVGTTHHEGNRITTGPDGGATLVYGDGSRVLVEGSSDYTYLGQKEGAEQNRLDLGSVRANIQHAQKKTSETHESGHRFIVRTKSMILGVRGTEFHMETDSTGRTAQVHTLTGQVDVAKDARSLFAGRGMAVMQNQFVSSQGGRFGAPQSFDRGQFMQQLERRQPQLNSLRQSFQSPMQNKGPQDMRPPGGGQEKGQGNSHGNDAGKARGFGQGPNQGQNQGSGLGQGSGPGKGAMGGPGGPNLGGPGGGAAGGPGAPGGIPGGMMQPPPGH